MNPPPDTTRSPTVEARGLWVTRFDWRTAEEVRALVDSAAAAHFNILYFQVRGNADAFYRPGLEPWGARLTGTLGADPGWDPLEVAVRQAHAHGIELHAWLNAFYGYPSSASAPLATDPPHALSQHPDWWMVDLIGQPITDESGRWLSPASDGARTRLAAVAADLARRYLLDGVHLDFVRYPFSMPVDSLSQAEWLKARTSNPALTLDGYRRTAVADAVRLVRDSLNRARASARLSAAVWGIYQNTRAWAAVSTGYDDRLQDPRAWATAGLLDAIAPMVYWPIATSYGARTDFAFLADDHAAAINQRHVYIGITLEHMIRTGQPFRTTELIAEIERVRDAKAEGVVILSAALLRQQNLWRLLGSGPFRRVASVPAMPWRGPLTAVQP
ncbi:MAG TPA: family 10 glycosylhydrolase [Longimicrobiales bacterium]|nr:family 10 glycosylhydrolase [Longimicrobiales bacterium]